MFVQRYSTSETSIDTTQTAMAKTATTLMIFLLCFFLVADVSQGINSNCLLRKAVGWCRGYFPSYYYNARAQTCERFIYGGCGGNTNRFGTLKACQETCFQEASQEKNSNCLLRKVVGWCRGYFPSYYYDAQTQKCERFIYGGCGGNANRFGTLKACQDTCFQEVSNGQNSDCLLPKVVGFCRASIPSYYYDTTTRKCEHFTYGGCGGNANRFGTLKACQEKCIGNKAAKTKRPKRQTGDQNT